MANKTIAVVAMLLVVGGPWSSTAEMSPYAPAEMIPASQKTATSSAGRDGSAPPPRRARLPRERRREGDIPGVVTIPYGKTASGERTHVYRIMGQGGVVADFTDYGAKLLRAYAPDGSADLANILEGFRPSVIDCEKAGELAEVWKMTPIRRPRATGLVFEREEKGPRVIYWLDASNQLTVESTIADTNAVNWASSVSVVPLRGRRLEIADALGTRSLANTTNSVSIALRPGTNVTEKVSLRFMPIGGK